MKQSQPSHINNTGYVIRVVSYGAAFLSVVYNLSFFMTVNIDFFSILSVEDHLLSFLIMLPIVASSLLINFYIDPPWDSEEKFPERYARKLEWVSLTSWEKNLQLLLPVLLIISLLWFKTNLDAWSLLIVSATTIWICILHSFFERSKVENTFSPPYKWYYYVGTLTILVAVFGVKNAEEKLSPKEKNLVSIERVEGLEQGYLIRASSNGVIIKQKGKESLLFVPQNNIKAISTPYTPLNVQKYREKQIWMTYFYELLEWLGLDKLINT